MTQEASDPRFGIHLVCITHSVHFSCRTHSSYRTHFSYSVNFSSNAHFSNPGKVSNSAFFSYSIYFSYRTDRTHITAPSLAEVHRVPFLSGGHAEPRLTFRGLCVIAPPMSLLFWIKRNAKTKTRKDLTNLQEPFHLPLALCHCASFFFATNKKHKNKGMGGLTFLGLCVIAPLPSPSSFGQNTKTKTGRGRN